MTHPKATSRSHRRRFGLPTLMFALLLGGCAVSTTDTIVTSPALRTGDAETTTSATLGLPASVAVLPFVNSTRSEFAYEAVRKTMFNHFASKNYRLVHWQDVDQRLALADVTVTELENKSPAELRQILGVDGLMYGNITHYNKTFAGVYAQISVGVELRMLNSEDAVVWGVKDVKRSHAGGISTNPVGLIMNALVAAKHLYGDVELYRAADDLGRTLADGMPEPENLTQKQRPVIADVIHSGVGQYLKYGDTLKIALSGDPGLQAAASIEGIGLIHLTEGESGQYTGEMTIDQGHEVGGLAVTGRLQDQFGQVASWVSPYGVLNVDNTPPAQIRALHVTPFDGAVALTWQSPEDGDIASYQILLARSETGAPERSLDALNSEVRVEGLTNFETKYANVSAVDHAGNAGKPLRVAVMAAPDPRFATAASSARTLPAALNGITRLRAADSPYFLTGNSRIPVGATVLVEPGVEIRVSARASLTVLGELRMFGSATRPVRASGADGQSFASFLELQSTQNVEIDGLVVEGGGIPIRIVAGSPVVRNTQLLNSEFNALTISGSARPVIENCLIQGADASGVIVEGQAQPGFRGNRFINNEPFHLQNGSTYSLDASGNTWQPPASPSTVLGDVTY